MRALTSLLLVVGTLAAQQTPTFGGPAPELALELLQAPGQTGTLTALRGNALVLEFWATWCAGCVEQIPHINALVEKYSDRPVRFVSITDEDKDLVQRFLTKRPISGWIGIDSTGATYRRYNVEGRPQTALIDGKGVLRGMWTPDSIDEATIEKLIAGTLPVAAQPQGTPSIGTEPNAPPPIFQALIRPAMPSPEVHMSPGATRLNPNKVEMWGVTIRRLLSRAYAVPEPRIIAPEWCDGAKFDVLLPAGPDKSVSPPLLRMALEIAFGVRAHPETRTIEVHVLRRFDDETKKLQESTYGRTLGYVLAVSESVFKHPVIDETGLTGRYTYKLDFPSERTALVKALADRLGFQLVPAQRSMEVLVVDAQERH